LKCQCSSTKLHIITLQNVAIFTCVVGLTNEHQRVDARFIDLKVEKEPASLTIQRSDEDSNCPHTVADLSVYVKTETQLPHYLV